VSPFVFRPPVVADLREAYRWYQGQQPGLGEEFLRAVRRAVDKVVSVPLGYAVVHRETRRALVPRFPYGLYFRVANETVVFVACFHLRRRPASWKRRR
jgi:plasmid stabilization system protein ParE